MRECTCFEFSIDLETITKNKIDFETMYVEEVENLIAWYFADVYLLDVYPLIQTQVTGHADYQSWGLCLNF